MLENDLNLANFDITPERGFLSYPDPLAEMPKGWEFLDQVGDSLPELIKSGDILRAAKVLPIPSLEALNSLNRQELMLAWVRYSFIQSAYVHSQAATPSSPVVICRNVALPVFTISKILEIPPILQYFAYTLYNWKRKDLNGLIAVDNLKLIQTFSRDADQSWFNLIHVDIESKAGPAINLLSKAVMGTVVLETALVGIASALEEMITVMKRMPEGTSPDTYYKIRRWIMFFENVIYEGVKAYGGKPRAERGQTGAQTSVFQAIEAGLQTPLLDKNTLEIHLMDMRRHMLKGHREFIEFLERTSTLRTIVVNSSSDTIGLYDQCVERILEFLSIHLGYAFFYIQRKTSNSKGTGGTDFMNYLSERIKERWQRAFIKPRTESDYTIFTERIKKEVEELLGI